MDTANASGESILKKTIGRLRRLAKIPMMADLHTWTLLETRDFMKVLIDIQSDRILSFAMFSRHQVT
jgi:hypothetical protein